MPAARFIPARRARDGGQHDRRRRNSMVGAGSVPGPEPACERAVQLVRARRCTSSTPTARPLRQARCRCRTPSVTAPDGGNTSFFIAGPDHRYQQPAVPWSSRRPPTNLSQNLPTLLRHFVGRAQRRGGGGPDAAEVPRLTPAQIRTAHRSVGRADERPGPGHLERAVAASAS